LGWHVFLQRDVPGHPELFQSHPGDEHHGQQHHERGAASEHEQRRGEREAEQHPEAQGAVGLAAHRDQRTDGEACSQCGGGETPAEAPDGGVGDGWPEDRGAADPGRVDDAELRDDDPDPSPGHEFTPALAQITPRAGADRPRHQGRGDAGEAECGDGEAGGVQGQSPPRAHERDQCTSDGGAADQGGVQPETAEGVGLAQQVRGHCAGPAMR